MFYASEAGAARAHQMRLEPTTPQMRLVSPVREGGGGGVPSLKQRSHLHGVRWSSHGYPRSACFSQPRHLWLGLGLQQPGDHGGAPPRHWGGGHPAAAVPHVDPHFLTAHPPITVPGAGVTYPTAPVAHGQPYPPGNNNNPVVWPPGMQFAVSHDPRGVARARPMMMPVPSPPAVQQFPAAGGKKDAAAVNASLNTTATALSTSSSNDFIRQSLEYARLKLQAVAEAKQSETAAAGADAAMTAEPALAPEDDVGELPPQGAGEKADG